MRLLACVLAALSLVGCGRRLTNANIDAVNAAFDRADAGQRADGVSTKEVESILGIPTKTETFKMELQTHKPVVEGTRYIYEQDGQKIVVHFVDNKLISKASYFGAMPEGRPEKKK